jgi:hypothetical protein
MGRGHVTKLMANRAAREACVLLVLAVSFIYTNSHFTFNDDEVAILNAAAQPAARTLHLFMFDAGQHEHPPAGKAHLRPSWTRMVLNTGYNGYVLFVSESVAPCFWRYGLPTTLAIGVSVVICFRVLRADARRFLIFAGVLVVVMAVMDILQTKRLFLIAPWVLLAFAVALGTTGNWQPRALVALLALIAGMGWYGTVSRQYYAAPRFIEPWPQVARQAVEAIHNGSIVVGNNPSFFFYLTYALVSPKFTGVLPVSVTHPLVWNSSQWNSIGHPTSTSILWVRGMAWSGNSAPPRADQMQIAGEWLDQYCVRDAMSHLLRDPGYGVKDRFYPELGEIPWRIEIRRYSCGDSFSHNPLPTH